jgi:carboxymethylenebutenolidase
MIEKTLDITTNDGEMETFICHPERNGPSPAVFFLMDAHGVREELKDMARRLGTVGYYVLLPNLYYRAGRDTIYGPDVQQEGSAEHTHASRPHQDDYTPGNGRHRRDARFS